MDIFRALNVSASGLTAQRARMDVIAENIANSDTTVTATGRPYQRKTVTLRATDTSGFDAMLPGAKAAGVVVDSVRTSIDPPRRVWQPEHPLAGADGFLELPNVNPVQEMTDMMASTRAYEANAVAFQAAKSLGAKLLELLR